MRSQLTARPHGWLDERHEHQRNAELRDVSDPLAGVAGSGLTRGVTSSSVKVGCYLTQQAFSGADDGFKARFERANTNKELPGGRTIDFSACQDDGNNPQTNLQIVQKLAQQEGDFAIVGISPNVLTASTDFVARSQVPMYVGCRATAATCGSSASTAAW